MLIKVIPYRLAIISDSYYLSEHGSFSIKLNPHIKDNDLTMHSDNYSLYPK